MPKKSTHCDADDFRYNVIIESKKTDFDEISSEKLCRYAKNKTLALWDSFRWENFLKFLNETT